MLQVQGINKSFAGKKVADKVSFTLEQGEILALLGASGSGKSTLLKMIAGLQTPDGGEVVLNGRCLNRVPAQDRKIALMFQDFALLPHLTVWENASLALLLRKMPKKQAKMSAQAMLTQLGLEALADRKVQGLSGGEQQRVALARALLAQPQLLLLDEPFSGIDSALRGQLQTQTRQLIKEKNLPALLVTHDVNEACLLADKIAVLVQGQIAQMGVVAEVLQRPINASVARLLGCVNVFEKRYFPPDCIDLNDEKGEVCRVVSLVRQSVCWRVVIEHPKWGELLTFADGAVAQNLPSFPRVSIHEEQIVEF